MRAYQFDDESLREILALAYSHGFADAASNDTNFLHQSMKIKEKDIKHCHWRMNFGDIVAGKEPEII